MDREAWRAAAHGVAKSRTRLSDRTDKSRDRCPHKSEVEEDFMERRGCNVITEAEMGGMQP